MSKCKDDSGRQVSMNSRSRTYVCVACPAGLACISGAARIFRAGEVAYVHLEVANLSKGIGQGRGILRRFIGEERQECPGLIEYALAKRLTHGDTVRLGENGWKWRVGAS